MELFREYIVVPEQDIIIQIYFFTSVGLFHDIFSIMAGYYFVEVISFIICFFIRKVTGYEQMSLLGTLKFSSVLPLGVATVLYEDPRFILKLWSAMTYRN